MSPSRIHARVPLSVAVEYRTAGAFLIAYTTNLSRGGLFIEASDLPPLGSDISLKLEVPGLDAPLDLAGRVAWHRESASEGSPRGFGVELSNLDQQYGAAIDQLVTGFERLKIAIIAWSASSRSQIVRYLRSILSCEIIECSGSDAARAAFARPVELALIDLDACPDDGLSLLDLAQGSPPTPIIALAKDEAMRLRARQLGAADAIATPPAFAALQTSILKTLSRPSLVRTLVAR